MRHCESIGRSAHLINLDPAADHFEYKPSKGTKNITLCVWLTFLQDIRDLITVDEVMEEFGLGPNGGLVYCLEFLLENQDWLAEDLGEFSDEFLIVDCPGQIELYTHYNVMTDLLGVFQRKDYHVAACYLMESQFLQDVTKYFAGVLNATSAMMKMAVPHLNIVSKMDLIEGEGPGKDEEMDEDISDEMHPLHRFFFPDPSLLSERLSQHTKPKFYRLNEALVQLIDEFDMVNFIPLNLKRESSMANMMSHIDHATQFSENLEPKEPKEFDDGDGEDDGDFGGYENLVDRGFEEQD